MHATWLLPFPLLTKYRRCSCSLFPYTVQYIESYVDCMQYTQLTASQLGSITATVAGVSMTRSMPKHQHSAILDWHCAKVRRNTRGSRFYSCMSKIKHLTAGFTQQITQRASTAYHCKRHLDRFKQQDLVDVSRYQRDPRDYLVVFPKETAEAATALANFRTPQAVNMNPCSLHSKPKALWGCQRSSLTTQRQLSSTFWE